MHYELHYFLDEFGAIRFLLLYFGYCLCQFLLYAFDNNFETIFLKIFKPELPFHFSISFE